MPQEICAKEELCRVKALAVLPPGCQLAAVLRSMGEPTMRKQFAAASPKFQAGVIRTYERILEHFGKGERLFREELDAKIGALTRPRTPPPLSADSE